MSGFEEQIPRLMSKMSVLPQIIVQVVCHHWRNSDSLILKGLWLARRPHPNSGPKNQKNNLILLLHIFSIWVKIWCHTKNKLPRYPYWLMVKWDSLISFKILKYLYINVNIKTIFISMFLNSIKPI